MDKFCETCKHRSEIGIIIPESYCVLKSIELRIEKKMLFGERTQLAILKYADFIPPKDCPFTLERLLNG